MYARHWTVVAGLVAGSRQFYDSCRKAMCCECVNNLVMTF